ncbi:hypothetical protein BGY98DRAFT_972224, partial [Russula aff. rugulosa BPL654]
MDRNFCSGFPSLICHITLIAFALYWGKKKCVLYSIIGCGCVTTRGITLGITLCLC